MEKKLKVQCSFIGAKRNKFKRKSKMRERILRKNKKLEKERIKKNKQANLIPMMKIKKPT